MHLCGKKRNAHKCSHPSQPTRTDFTDAPGEATPEKSWRLWLWFHFFLFHCCSPSPGVHWELNSIPLSLQCFSAAKWPAVISFEHTAGWRILVQMTYAFSSFFRKKQTCNYCFLFSVIIKTDSITHIKGYCYKSNQIKPKYEVLSQISH